MGGGADVTALVEGLPGFVRWATPADPGGTAQIEAAIHRKAWFEPAGSGMDRPGGFRWRLPDPARFDLDRPCSGRFCERDHGVRPIVAVLERRRTGTRRPSYVATFCYCEQHTAGYAIYLVGGRLLWLREFR